MPRSARHPGQILQEEYLEPMGISAGELAQAIHLPEHTVRDLLHAQQRCTGDFAIRLSRALQTQPQFWLGLQNLWDLQAAARDIHTAEIGVLV